ncbi:hypothetical protein Plhal304r1_c071g0160191 [Plasmopara halstedii]
MSANSAFLVSRPKSKKNLAQSVAALFSSIHNETSSFTPAPVDPVINLISHLLAQTIQNAPSLLTPPLQNGAPTPPTSPRCNIHLRLLCLANKRISFSCLTVRILFYQE